MVERLRVAVQGLVQGVGLRPYVHSLATALELRGFVRNEADGVMIDVEGGGEALEQFVHELVTAPPLHAAIERVQVEAAPPVAFDGFSIVASATDSDVRTLIPPDVATCDACLAELNDPANRRHRHAFISCVHCGPRFTIIQSLPYDRSRTTMAVFPLCRACQREHDDPRDRRFHAQTIACHDCGPVLWLTEAASEQRWGGGHALEAAIDALLGGAIVAVKGIGGYHLACDATNTHAVRQLRERKRREAKPLAIMVADVDAARTWCEVSEQEAALLASPHRPIVLIERRDDIDIVSAVAPASRSLGVMLPYTPVHHLLLAGAGRPLVLTSGNRSDEPIAVDDDDARRCLTGIADWFLGHDRPIASRCDDSVMRVTSGAPTFLRRSRGVAPRPVRLPVALSAPTLGVGGHLKNTFCLARDARAFLSSHVGDLEQMASVKALRDAVSHLERLLDVRPRTIVHDLHPEYASTRLATALAAERGDIRLVGVQHHHAHVAACVAEHGVMEPVIGVVFDGAGLGTDGAIWGGELLFVERHQFRRLGHLAYVPLPGGDGAARHPWRSAVAHLWAAQGGDPADAVPHLAAKVNAGEWSLVGQMVRRGVQTYPTSSVGRLFDAVAAIVGLRTSSRFEGEAAMMLEAAADGATASSYPVEIAEGDDQWIAHTAPVVAAVARDRLAGCDTSAISGAFHNTLRDLIVAWGERARELTSVTRIALTGGVFQNVLLTTLAADALTRRGFTVLLHERAPCNDGGLSLGQVWAAPPSDS